MSSTIVIPDRDGTPREYVRGSKTAQKARRRHLLRQAAAAIAAGVAPRIREDAGWSAIEVATVIGTTTGRVLDWERGQDPLHEANPAAYSYAKLLNVLASKPAVSQRQAG